MNGFNAKMKNGFRCMERIWFIFSYRGNKMIFIEL